MSQSSFSETVMDHFQTPRNHGQLENPSGTGIAGSPGQGPFIVIQLKSEGNLISKAMFQCHPCGATIASASMTTELAQGKTIKEARTITSQDLLDALDGLPPHKRHCANLAIQALSNALDDM